MGLAFRQASACGVECPEVTKAVMFWSAPADAAAGGHSQLLAGQPVLVCQGGTLHRSHQVGSTFVCGSSVGALSLA